MVGRRLFIAAGIVHVLAACVFAQADGGKKSAPRAGVWKVRLVDTEHQHFTGRMTLTVDKYNRLNGDLVWREASGDAGEELPERFQGQFDDDFSFEINSQHVNDDWDVEYDDEDEYNYEYDEVTGEMTYRRRNDAGQYSAIIAAGGRVLRKGKWMFHGRPSGYWSAKWTGPLPAKK